MPRLALLEGNTAIKRAGAAKLGVRTSSEIYKSAINCHFPEIEFDVINGADADWEMPSGRTWGDYDGFVITGSSLHAYDREFAVTNQIELLTAVADTGMPIFGSCWGLQIAAVAGGGEVTSAPGGREVGIARKIVPRGRGSGHRMFALKGLAFDAPCIHYDQVTRLPAGAELLASNAHSEVQAAEIPLGKSKVWAVQYHPEFDLLQLVQLYRLYAEDLITQGFFKGHDELCAYLAKLEALIADPSDAGLAWQLGIDDDILIDRRRNGEIIAWIEAEVLGPA